MNRYPLLKKTLFSTLKKKVKQVSLKVKTRKFQTQKIQKNKKKKKKERSLYAGWVLCSVTLDFPLPVRAAGGEGCGAVGVELWRSTTLATFIYCYDDAHICWLL